MCRFSLYISLSITSYGPCLEVNSRNRLAGSCSTFRKDLTWPWEHWGINWSIQRTPLTWRGRVLPTLIWNKFLTRFVFSTLYSELSIITALFMYYFTIIVLLFIYFAFPTLYNLFYYYCKTLFSTLYFISFGLYSKGLV